MRYGKGDQLLAKLVWEKHRSETLCSRCSGVGYEMDHRKIGTLMKACRESAGLSLRELGERVSLSAGYLHDLEHGRRQWSMGLFVEVDSALRGGPVKRAGGHA